jgi:hypothetical protein
MPRLGPRLSVGILVFIDFTLERVTDSCPQRGEQRTTKMWE